MGSVHEVRVVTRAVPGGILIVEGLEAGSVIVECVSGGSDDVVVVSTTRAVRRQLHLAAVELPDRPVTACRSSDEMLEEWLLTLEREV